MLRPLRNVLSSSRFLLCLAVLGLILFSWPLVTVLAVVGPFGQLLSLFGVWLVLGLGALIWSLLHPEPKDPGEARSPACAWPPDTGEGQ